MVIILPRLPEYFCVAFLLQRPFLFTIWHFLTLPNSYTLWWLLKCFQLSKCSPMIISTQMISCIHFVLKCWNITLNFNEISSRTWDAILVKHLTAWNFERMKSLGALIFIQISGPAQPHTLDLILLLLDGFWERYFP